MKYTREVETDAKGRVVVISESVAFDTDQERREWWEKVTKTLADTSRYFPKRKQPGDMTD